MRVAPPCQLPLDLAEIATPSDHWPDLPETAQGKALVLLARLIARGVLIDDSTDVSDRARFQRRRQST
jgi:hypothetical protein